MANIFGRRVENDCVFTVKKINGQERNCLIFIEAWLAGNVIFENIPNEIVDEIILRFLSIMNKYCLQNHGD